MTALYNRVAWAIVGLLIGAIFFAFTYLMYTIEGDSAGGACLISALIGVFFVRQFLLAPPLMSVKDWWRQNIAPSLALWRTKR